MRARSLVAAVATAAMAGGVALAAPAQADAHSSATSAKLATLAVKGRAPKSGYDRSRFGVAWTDDVTVADGHNGCDTRNDILRRDLVAVEIKPGSNGCAVLGGPTACCGTPPRPPTAATR